MKRPRRPTPSQSNLLRSVRQMIEDLHPEEGLRILVACSGGADSTALLDLLRQLSKTIDLELGVAHVDHRQHPASGSIGGRLKAKCRRLGLSFHWVQANPRELPPGSNEGELRNFRYRALRTIARHHGYSYVATAHTLDDQAETILLRILRGTGTKGLAGIPDRRGRFIRPVLGCQHLDLVQHLRKRHLRWSEDPTNQDLRIPRNRLRHLVMPLLRRSFNPRLEEALVRLSKAARCDESVLNSLARQVATREAPGGGACVPLPVFEVLPEALQTRVLIRMAGEGSGRGSRLELVQIERILRTLDRSTKSSWSLDLPGGLRASRENRTLCLRRAIAPPERHGFHVVVPRPGWVKLPHGSGRLRFRLQSTWTRGQAGSMHAFFDARLARFPLEIRSRRPGDRIRQEDGSTRKVARVLMDAHVPQTYRVNVPLLIRQGQILWIAGVRRSVHARISRRTHRILGVTWAPPRNFPAPDRP